MTTIPQIVKRLDELAREYFAAGGWTSKKHIAEQYITQLEELYRINPLKRFKKLVDLMEKYVGKDPEKARAKLDTYISKAEEFAHKLAKTPGGNEPGVQEGEEEMERKTNRGTSEMGGSQTYGDQGRAFQTAPVIQSEEALEQIQAMNDRIAGMVHRERLLPRTITGERVLRSRLVYDDGISLIPTRGMKIRNATFMAKFSWPLDGIGNLGNQQPLPFEVGLPADNSLITAWRKNNDIRYNGEMFDSGAYVRKHMPPSQELLDIYHTSMIRRIPIEQERMNIHVDAARPAENFIMKRTNDLAPPEVQRRSLDNRLYFQTLVDGKWT